MPKPVRLERTTSPLPSLLAALQKKPDPKPPPEPTLAERDSVASKQLVERYDALNQVFAVAEQRLKALKPPRSVWVEYNYDPDFPEQPDSPCGFELLGIDKINSQWRLVHAYGHQLHDEMGPSGIQPLVECPVDIRVRAASMLERLHIEIVEAKERYIPAVELAINQVIDYCKGGGA